MVPLALVTGASRGIGRAIALRLAEEGYAVAVHYRANTPAAEETARLVRGRGADAVLCRADVADERAVREMVASLERAYAHIDLLVNNAGIAAQALFTEVTSEQWRRMMDVHVNGAFYTSSAVLPGMIRRRSGQIVNIASVWGQTGASCEVPYSTAKAALIGMTRALAKEVAPSGVRVNAVAPGAVATDMLATFSEEDLRALEDETPLGRIGAPEDIAGAVAFLASRDAAFITGQVIAVNGGLYI